MNITKSKRSIVSLVLAVAMILSMFPMMMGAMAVSAADQGDITLDGTINMRDCMKLFTQVSTGSGLTEDELANADVNGDGSINMRDVMALYNFVKGGGDLPVITTTTTESTTTTTTETETTTTTTTATVPDIDMMVFSNVVSNENATVTEMEDGTWLIESTDAGSVGIKGPGSYDADALRYTHLVIRSDVPFVVAFYDDANNKWMTSDGDFYPDFGCATGNTPADVGYYKLSLFTNGCYTWDGSALPETVNMGSIYIEPKAAGNIVVAHMALSSKKDCICDVPNVTLPTTTVTTTTREMMGEVITYSVADATASVGDIVNLPVSVTANHAMVNGQIIIKYDPTVLELTVVSDDPDYPYFTDGSYNYAIFKAGAFMCAGASPEPGTFKFAFASTASTGSNKGGDVFDLSFKVLAEGDGTVSILVPEMVSNNGTTNGGQDYNTNVQLVNGVVTIA